MNHKKITSSITAPIVCVLTLAASAPVFADSHARISAPDRPIAHEAAHVVQQRLYGPGSAHYSEIKTRLRLLRSILTEYSATLSRIRSVGIKEEGVKRVNRTRSNSYRINGAVQTYAPPRDYASGLPTGRRSY